MDRRTFLKIGAAAGTGMFLNPLGMLGRLNSSGEVFGATSQDPHFFIQILVPGGMDNSYLFDSRPLAMTQAKMIQNYLGTDPTRWTGANGVETWASTLTDPLKSFRDDFSILNGVVMSPTFDGHNQNMSLLMTGDPFGTELFIPKIGPEDAMSALQKGAIPGGITFDNAGRVVQLDAQSAEALISKLSTSQMFSPDRAAFKYIQSRFQSLSSRFSTDGQFSQASAAMSQGFALTPDLVQKIKQVQVIQDEDQDHRFLALALEFFKRGLTRSCLWIPDSKSRADTHDPESAKQQPALFQGFVALFADMIKTMKETPFDQTRSMYDVTTFMMCSEIGRTMRQKNAAFENTGTDHNSFNNMILLGGKGIVSGQVIGSTDFQTAGEVLSGAHQAADTDLVKVMGRPFDFSTMQSRTDLPVELNLSDYLTGNSVMNTIYSAFGLPADQYRLLQRNDVVAPVIQGLLRS